MWLGKIAMGCSEPGPAVKKENDRYNLLGRRQRSCIGDFNPTGRKVLDSVLLRTQKFV